MAADTVNSVTYGEFFNQNSMSLQTYIIMIDPFFYFFWTQGYPQMDDVKYDYAIF